MDLDEMVAGSKVTDTAEDRHYEIQARAESIQVLISELARKSHTEIAMLFDKIIAEGGKEAIDALVFIGDFSQA